MEETTETKKSNFEIAIKSMVDRMGNINKKDLMQEKFCGNRC